ncbi:sulfotransferase [Cribrihabitans marinus]|nr:sulfotransferase [Cribrihabitans marinus]
MPRRPQPVHVCIGAPRSGTTWLYENLRRSGTLFLPCVKEVRYWWGSRSDAERHKVLANRRISHEADAEQLDWLDRWEQTQNVSAPDYLDLMARPDRPSLDISPIYSTMPSERITALRDALPEASRVFVMLRNPFERNKSVIRLHGYMRGCFRGPMADATLLRYLESGFQKRHRDYARTVRLWRAAFGDRFGIFYHDELQADPERFLLQVQHFLGCPAVCKIDAEVARTVYNTQREGRPRAVSVLTPRQIELIARLSLNDARAFAGIDPVRAAMWEDRILPLCGDSLAVPPIPTDPDPVAELLRLSESLGETCDFALFQRDSGYEPASLLRWSQTPLDEVMALLDASGAEQVPNRFRFRADLAGKNGLAGPQTPLSAEDAFDWLRTRFRFQLNKKPGLYVVTTRGPLTDTHLMSLRDRLWAWDRRHRLLHVHSGPATDVQAGADGIFRAQVPLVEAGCARADWQRLFKNLAKRTDIQAMTRRLFG